MTEEQVAEARTSKLEELLMQDEPEFVKNKDVCQSRCFIKGLGTMFVVATAVGVRQNIKELTTRKRLRKYYILPLSIAGLAALAVTQYEYNKCKEKFFKDWYEYHKARNFTRFPEGTDTAV